MQGFRAPAHRFRPGKGFDDAGQNLGQHLDGGPSLALDHGDIELALLAVALDLGLIERGEACAFQEPCNRGLRCADARPLALLARIGLRSRQARDMQRKPARRRKARGALIKQALGDERIGHELAQILRRLRLHARGDFFGEQFEEKVGHGNPVMFAPDV